MSLGWGVSSVMAAAPEIPETSQESNRDSPSAAEVAGRSGIVRAARRSSEQKRGKPPGHQGQWGRFNWGNGEFAGFGPVGHYGTARWAEDWSSLSDPHNRTDLFDPLKFIALNDDKTIWLSFSGESRIRNWAESRPQMGIANVRDSRRFSVQNIIGADLHLGKHVRLFSQVINADAGGWRPYDYSNTWRHDIALQQLFIELNWKIASAQTGLLVGRQQFLDAPRWVLYNRDTPDMPLSWNGVRAYAIWDSFKIDAFNFVETELYNTHNFGGGFDETNRLYGVNMAYALPTMYWGKVKLRSFFNLFWMGYRFGGRMARVGHVTGYTSGTQTRHNIGFRWAGNLPSFEYDIGAVYQFGQFHGESGPTRDVSAYGLHTILGWRGSKKAWNPFIGILAELYSGAHQGRSRGTLTGFIEPFSPQSGSFDATRTFGRSNIMSISPLITMTPLSHVSFRLKVPFLWRHRLSDTIYGYTKAYDFFLGDKLRAAGRRIGIVPQGRVTWQINPHLTWTVDGGYVFLTHKMKKVGAKNESFMLSTLTFRF